MPRIPTRLLLAAAVCACFGAGAHAQSEVRPPTPQTEAPAGDAGKAQPPTDAEALEAERTCAQADSLAARRDPNAGLIYARALRIYLDIYIRRWSPILPGPSSFRAETGARLRRMPECADGYLRTAADVNAFEREQVEAFRGQVVMLSETDESRAAFLGSEVEQRAEIKRKPEPGFPEEARRKNVRGTVRVRAVLAADGTVKHVLVLKGLPHGISEQAIAAARRIVFTPAVKGGRPVSQFVVLEYNFQTY
jgi:TonB family protein